MAAASSVEALGIIPGSLNAVLNNDDITKIKIHAATNGTAGLTSSYKNRELQEKQPLIINFHIIFYLIQTQ